MSSTRQQKLSKNFLWYIGLGLICAGCTVKAVGDPNRPITINAHVIVDIRGLEKTASNIEDYVSGDQPTLGSPKAKEGTQ